MLGSIAYVHTLHKWRQAGVTLAHISSRSPVVLQSFSCGKHSRGSALPARRAARYREGFVGRRGRAGGSSRR